MNAILTKILFVSSVLLTVIGLVTGDITLAVPGLVLFAGAVDSDMRSPEPWLLHTLGAVVGFAFCVILATGTEVWGL